jgi:2-oxoglutarate dehydrogenase E2 component (dihydrolipoamide succinyltransferase)
MPATLDGLAADLQRFFVERFPQLDAGDGPGSVLLVFDNLGRPLSPREFAGSGTGAARDLLSHQRAADLADQIPAPNALKRGWYLPRSGSRLSRWYATLLSGSVAAPESGATPADLAAFEAAKDGALRLLEENKLVAVSGSAAAGDGGTVAAAGTHDAYYATSMSPLDWYTDSAACWSTYEVAAADAPAAAAAAGPVATPQFALRVAADPSAAELVDYVRYATETEPDRPDQPDPVESSRLLIPAGLRRLNALLNAQSGLVSAGDTAPVRGVQLARDAQPVSVERSLDRSQLAGIARLAGSGAADAVAARMVAEVGADAVVPDRRVSPVDAAIGPGAALTAVVDATAPKPATSQGFGVHFEYCLVHLDRPWWDEVFLSRQDWRVPGYQAGQISSGTTSGAADIVSLITTGMVVIRNLTITATWSEADLAALPHSTSLGPFCIAAGDLDKTSGTLTRKGLQVIAWLVQVPPVLPPRP